MAELPEHPEANNEDQHLRQTLATLEARIEEIGSWDVKGFQTNDTASLQRLMVKLYDSLVSARKQVYFGRLDVLPVGPTAAAGAAPAEGAVPEAHYIGRTGFDQRGQIVVVDWRAPLARLFSRRRPGRVDYNSPDGRLTVQLQLKRHLELDAAALRGVFDEYDSRPDSVVPGESRAALVDPDAYLRLILSGRRDAQMSDIVATIQEHQDDLIRAEPRQVLVIQGVAGSGKTAMALHRVAYLLYPGNQLNIEARRCIVFGPNQLFLGYIANVLPGLGVADIPQTTLDRWALERMGLAERATTDATLAALLDPAAPPDEKKRLVQRSQLLGSLRLGQVLERLAEWWRGRFSVPAQGLAYPEIGPLKVTVRLSKTRVIELQQSVRELPVMRQRERLAELVLGELMGAYATAFDRRSARLTEEGEDMRDRQQALLEEAARLEDYAAFAEREADLDLEQNEAAGGLKQGARALRALAEYVARRGEAMILRTARIRDEGRAPKHRAALLGTLRPALETDLDRMWPALDPPTALEELLADRHLLARLSRGLLSIEEVVLLERPVAQPGAALDLSELPALCYLHTLSQGVAVPLYDHMVVDEAQDVAPLYYAALRRFSRNGSLTILGDMAQGVFAHRGLTGWDEVQRAFEGLAYSFGEVVESYRSTYEIITFANRLLELLAAPGQPPLLAKPFERHGAPVEIRRIDRPEGLAPQVAQAIARLERDGYRNIAVIAKTADECENLAAALRGEGTAGVQTVTGADQPYEGGTLVLPVHLAKGMEFEAVLLAGADEVNYPSAEFEGRLLYVAATRALHALQIFAVGPVSALVELAAE